jgi:hypothetical protein
LHLHAAATVRRDGVVVGLLHQTGRSRPGEPPAAPQVEAREAYAAAGVELSPWLMWTPNRVRSAGLTPFDRRPLVGEEV